MCDFVYFGICAGSIGFQCYEIIKCCESRLFPMDRGNPILAGDLFVRADRGGDVKIAALAGGGLNIRCDVCLLCGVWDHSHVQPIPVRPPRHTLSHHTTIGPNIVHARYSATDSFIAPVPSCIGT